MAMEVGSPKRPVFDTMGCLSDCGAATSVATQAPASTVVIKIFRSFMTITPHPAFSLMTLAAALQPCQDDAKRRECCDLRGMGAPIRSHSRESMDATTPPT